MSWQCLRDSPKGLSINVGSKVSLWRRAWRDKILPALARFEPDLICISAGFDAHRKDHLNHRYIGLHERDYEWVTGQIIQVSTLSACSVSLEQPMRIVMLLAGSLGVSIASYAMHQGAPRECAALPCLAERRVLKIWLLLLKALKEVED